jgi:hypothetical protein
MIVKNQLIEGKYKGSDKSKAYENLGSQSTLLTIGGLLLGLVKTCISNQATTAGFMEMAQGFTNFNDAPG